MPDAAVATPLAQITGIPPVQIGTGTPAPSGPAPEDFAGQTDKAIAEKAAFEKDLNRRQDVATAPLKADIEKSSQEISKIAEKPPETLPLPVNAAKHVDQKELMNSAQVFMVLGALGGLFMRQPMTAALGNMTAAMKGVQEGDAQQYDRAMAEFKTNFDTAMKRNKQLLDERQQILSDKSLSLTQKINQLKLKDIEYGVEYSRYLDSFNGKIEAIKAHENQYYKAQAAAQRVADMHQRMQEHREDMAQRERMHKESMGVGGAGGEQLSPAGLKAATELVRAGLPLPNGWSKAGMSRGNAILNALGAEEPGGAGSGTIVADRAKYAAYKSALTANIKDVASIKPYKEMLELNGDKLKSLAEKIIKTDAPLANKTVNWLQTHAGDNPDVREFMFQMEIWRTETARLITNPRIVGQLTDTSRKDIESVTSGNMSLESTARVIDRGRADATNRVSKLESEGDELVGKISNIGAPKPENPSKPSLDAFLAKARAANPGKSDADLTAYYNKEYGSK